MSIVKLFKTFLGAWARSCAILLPKNLKLFLLVTLKSVVRVYIVIFSRFWWLFLAFCAFSFFYFSHRNMFLNTLFSCITFLIFITTRPSVDKKTFSYYKKYLWHLLVFVLCMFFLLKISKAFIVSSPLFAFFIFFWIDSGEILPAARVFIRTIILFLFALPVCLLYSLVFGAIDRAFLNYFILSYGMDIGFIYGYALLLLPLQVSFMVNLYIKNVHDSYTEFYNYRNVFLKI
ncbi:hypothetical protein HN446_00710 [bacterium]|mgnify:CR=1 FL=1|jgi:hypothetical protein|nr:hypothetical protein [bacterium]